MHYFFWGDMMIQKIEKELPTINHDTCTLCGKCVEVCPKRVLDIRDKKVIFTGEPCILCSHCYSVCKFDAIDFKELLFEPSFTSFKYKSSLTVPGSFSPEDLVNLARSRRSVRKFTEKPVSEEALRDLVTFGITAPSASNCQLWEFAVLGNRPKVVEFGKQFELFFRKLNGLVRNPLIRWVSPLFAGMALVRYYRDRYATVERGLEEVKQGKDLLFWGAPAVIIIHSSMEGSLPVEDAQYAAYNITLLAHAMGMGTCFIGYASETMNRVKKIKRSCGIPDKNRVHAVLAVGYPAEKFHKQALRKHFTAEFI